MRVTTTAPLHTARALLLPLLLLLAACESDPRRRGSDDCRAWQDALCEYSATRCGTVDLEACEEAAFAIECRLDTLASDCAAELDVASCGSPPDGCDLVDVADREFAVGACLRLVETRCGAFAMCEEGLTRCIEAAGELPCDEAVGVAEGYADCIASLQNVSCGGAVPPACAGAILLYAP